MIPNDRPSNVRRTSDQPPLRRGGDAPAKLAAYAAIYAGVLRERRMCLCGMLAADYDTLPQPMQAAVIRLFDDNEAWLRGVLEHGRDEGSLRLGGPASDAAQTLVSGLEGALLIARPYRDAARVETATNRLLTSLVGKQRTDELCAAAATDE